MTENPYQTIKRSIADAIATRVYVPGQALPSEHQLCRTFGVARMTVNRAMRELAAEQLVRRVPGVGSFVAVPLAQSGLLELRNIADEIRDRGHVHGAAVLALEASAPPALVACAFELPPGGALYHSVILHAENDLPIQYEDRWVDPAMAPDYLRQDFAAVTPNEYLVVAAPVSEVAHEVQAVAAPPQIAARLRLAEGEPCLKLTRRTWSGDRLASFAELYHPASRFRLTGRFAPPGAPRLTPKALAHA